MRSIRLVLMASAGAGLAVALASPADARQCGSGQIFQVSKGRCISKTAAAKAGIVVHRKTAALKPAKDAAARPDADENETQSNATRIASGAKAEKSDQTRGEQIQGADTPPPVRNVAVRSDPAKAREAWNAAVAAAEKGGEATTAPPLSFAPQEGDVNRSIAPFGALQFGGLR